ncbi:hypothetical protein D3C72_1688780 [compost metagenome]
MLIGDGNGHCRTLPEKEQQSGAGGEQHGRPAMLQAGNLPHQQQRDTPRKRIEAVVEQDHALIVVCAGVPGKMGKAEKTISDESHS